MSENTKPAYTPDTQKRVLTELHALQSAITDLTNDIKRGEWNPDHVNTWRAGTVVHGVQTIAVLLEEQEALNET